MNNEQASYYIIVIYYYHIYWELNKIYKQYIFEFKTYLSYGKWTLNLVFITSLLALEPNTKVLFCYNYFLLSILLT